MGDNGKPSISIACAVHSEHQKLINYDHYARHKKTSKAAVFHVNSMQGFKYPPGRLYSWALLP